MDGDLGMIQITDKQKCCGCEACVQACPQRCIRFEPDAEGFRYPSVDVTKCVNCGRCEQVCPVQHPNKPNRPTEVLAAMNTDDIVREQSSSGGVFTLLAERVISEGGVVFGVRFNDDWQAVFDYTESREGLSAFRGSKYVQARVGHAFQDVKVLLEAGRKVLFAGTPCQVAALRRFLPHADDHLVCMDFICHGVPSPKIWGRFLDEVVPANRHSISSVNFRDKRRGWKQYMTAVGYKNDGVTCIKCLDQRGNDYMDAFRSNLTLRPSCHACPAKGGRSHSDITIGDFWGIDQVNAKMDDGRGTSVVMIHTPKGKTALSLERLKWEPATYDDVVRHNRSVELSASCHPHRDKFFAGDYQGDLLQEQMEAALRPTIIQSVIKWAMSTLRRVKRLMIIRHN